jgi:hypothetical protein
MTIGEAVSHTKVADLLICIPRIGVVSVREILQELVMKEDIRFSDLTPERRQDLAHIVRLLKWKPA